jgi:uncharacterized protein (DUF1697 family)
MKTYIALLRGINVSGQKMIKMAALLEMFNSLNVKNAKTYIQSGNIVFQCKEAEKSTLEKKIENKIKDTFGFDVAVVMITSEELKDILKHNPYLKNKNTDFSRLYLTFFKGTYEQQILAKLSEADYKGDEFILKEKVIYLHLPNNYGNTKLNNNFFENKLKIVATTRNWKTVNELQKMAEEIA